MRIGIVGGGQLGRMMALAARPMNVEFTFIDPAPDACAQSFGVHLQCDYDDDFAIEELINTCDAVTFEFENVPPAAVAKLAEHLPAHPNAKALQTARDRWHEKSMFIELGIPVPKLATIDSEQDLQQALATVGLPAVLKTRTMGYDGKGQKVLRSEADVAGSYIELGEVPLIMEGFVDFDHEVSIVAVRSRSGEVSAWPITQNEHRQGILHCSRPVAAHPLQAQAADYASRVMQHLDYVGVMAFEFFVTADGLLANEIAPRVHNSGHWTIEGAVTSQFANHVRAIAGLPIGSTERLAPCAMLNVIGGWPDIEAILSVPGASWHDYGKDARAGRKIGHITVVAESESELDERLAQLEPLLNNLL
ncbi:5-(carboxyamino)imidazole ribonucleotide synthase [Salinibius halmophilus]|uniref:5-(carboxyamino)imidazole ribonucleotide synthase n=1 Tax=Salinibius halmophilus TaxID=1853216 RepID=UPI000E667AE7|nr:5-(carboxyamino)imidazole ribonucleotide synthase [Salinibius halmophilus]